ncbi:MAG: Hint domain-containing protein [Pseudomonadota bacterium]
MTVQGTCVLVEIKAGALRNGQPKRTPLLLPQHRILMSGPLVQKVFCVPEVLAPANALIGMRGVRVCTASGK